MKTSKWIFDFFNLNSIDPISSKFVSVEPQDESNDSMTNLLKWDNTSVGRLCKTVTTFPTVSFIFKKPISFSNYKMQVKRGLRFMTGWRIDASFDGKRFTTIDSKDESFCFKNYTNQFGHINCDEFTSRSFDVPITTAKVIRLVQTKEDSCGTYCINMNWFDIYGNPSNAICINTCQTCRNSRMKLSLILFIIIDSC